MKRFQTLQWQLTAAYSIVSLILIVLIFFVGGYGYLFYNTLSGRLGDRLLDDMNVSFRQIEFTDEIESNLQAIDAITQVMWMGCQTPILSDGSFISRPMIDPLFETCPSSHRVTLNFHRSEGFVSNYQEIYSLAMWFPEGDPAFVDQDGLQFENIQVGNTEQAIIQKGFNGGTTATVEQFRTVVYSPVLRFNVESQMDEVVAVVKLAVGLNANYTLPTQEDAAAFAIPITILFGFTFLIGVIGSYWVTRRVSKRVSTLGSLSEEWAMGNFATISHDSSPDEVGQLSRRLNSMVEQLQNSLEVRTELTAVEERNKIARDLHDAAKQQIFAADMQLYAAENLIDNDPSRAKTHLQEARRLTKSIQSELSTLIAELRPAQLEGKGLFEAVRETAVAFQERNDIEVELRLAGEQELPLSVEQPLYRLLQEALSNIARHSQASRVIVHLSAEKDKIQLEINDNGIGFDRTQIKQGVGLQSMKERIEALSGTFTLHTLPTRGTTVTAVVPLRD
ncbi:MAG: HAMP domain-containing sensor histidine kinase [Chloroflexota bacterium]